MDEHDQTVIELARHNGRVAGHVEQAKRLLGAVLEELDAARSAGGSARDTVLRYQSRLVAAGMEHGDAMRMASRLAADGVPPDLARIERELRRLGIGEAA